MQRIPPKAIVTIALSIAVLGILCQGSGVYALEADADGPYTVDEGKTMELDGENSTGTIENYDWAIMNDPSGGAYLTGDDQENAKFHAPEEVDENVEVKVRLTVTNSEEETDFQTTTVTVKDILASRPGGPYQVEEEKTITLDGSNSSGYIENWNWAITDNPTGDGKAYLTNDGQSQATFHAPNVPSNKEVTVRLIITGPNGKSVSKTTSVTIQDPFEADAGGPYSVYENAKTTLSAAGSNGKDDASIETYSWIITDDPTGKAYITDESSESATFHAPKKVNENKPVKVKLFVADEQGNSGEVTTTVTVMDRLISIPGGPYEVKENETITLNGENSSGYIQAYNWTITEDPLENSRLSEADTATPTFHAPPNVETEENVGVKLIVASSSKTDAKTVQIKVKPSYTPPDSPTGLQVEGSSSPGEVLDPTPQLSAIYEGNNSEVATKAQIKVGTGENGEDMWNSTVEGLSVSPGDRFSLDYGGGPLLPEQTYYWGMRFYDRGWGSWSDGTDQFTMGKCEDIIEASVDEDHGRDAADMLLEMEPSDAASGLSKADSQASAKVMEEIILINTAGSLNILGQMNPENIATIIVEIAKLPSSPEKAATLFEMMAVEEVKEVVETIIGRGDYGALDNIFKELSAGRTDEVFSSLSSDRKNQLYPHLSSEVREKISYSPGGIPWMMIGGALAAIIGGAFVWLRFLRGNSSGGGESESGQKLSKAQRKRWVKLIKKFAKSDKERAGIKTQVPSGRALKTARFIIKKMGGENAIGAKRSNGKVYLIRK